MSELETNFYTILQQSFKLAIEHCVRTIGYMFSFIDGIVIEIASDNIVIEVNGIGYEVYIPYDRVVEKIVIGQRYKFHTSVVYREDSQKIYGFLECGQRDFFKVLVEKVSGVGPKLALTILNYFEFGKLREIIELEEVDSLSECPGIGKKTAKKMLLDLKGNLKSLSEVTVKNYGKAGVSAYDDTIMALISLGCTKMQAEKLLNEAVKSIDKAKQTTENLLAAALKLKSK